MGRKSQETQATRTITTYKGNIPSNNPADEQLFRYTSGRWLWDEEQQLRDRYRTFNIPQLQTLAAQAIGSEGCESITKLAEGGFNKVFRLKMNDGKTILARIPNPNAGPAFYTTASKVATMEFVRDILQIPVPRILVCLLMITSHGSIYFASDAVDGAVPAQITGEATSEMNELVSKKFTIGPSAARDFWQKERSGMDISRGPWSSPREYPTSIGVRELEWIKKYAIPKPAKDVTLVSTAQNVPYAHINLLEKYLSIVPCLMDVEQTLSRPTLWHCDLHASNIFVENNTITAVIDWQGSWVGPLFLQAQPSPLVDYQGDILLKRPDNFDDLDTEQQTQIKRQVFRSTLFQLYLMETRKRNHVLAQAFHLDHGKTRRLPVELAGNTWDDEIVPFRESLINVERHWQELGCEGDCPYRFTKDELRSHAADAEGWNEVQDFFDSIERPVKRDGWTHPETFDAAVEFFSHLRTLGLKGMKGEERERFDRQTSWAKDRSRD